MDVQNVAVQFLILSRKSVLQYLLKRQVTERNLGEIAFIPPGYLL